MKEQQMMKNPTVKERNRAIEERAERGRRGESGRRGEPSAGARARDRLLSGRRVSERRLRLADVSTTVLEGGRGAPVVLLHGPGGSAVHWWRVMDDLVATHRLVIPDLPGQGSSEVGDDQLDGDRVAAWLGELIEECCPSPPALVGCALGGAIAARFASDHGERIDSLVMVDSLGLRDFEPAPDFGLALGAFLAEPDERTHERLWRQCALDLDGMRQRIGESWEAFEAYNLDRARTPGVMAALEILMGELGLPAIPPEKLARIAVPTTLIWGRYDLATPLQVAEAASERYGWQLQVIESCADDPPVEQPEMFVAALRAALRAR